MSTPFATISNIADNCPDQFQRDTTFLADQVGWINRAFDRFAAFPDLVFHILTGAIRGQPYPGSCMSILMRESPDVVKALGVGIAARTRAGKTTSLYGGGLRTPIASRDTTRCVKLGWGSAKDEEFLAREFGPWWDIGGGRTWMDACSGVERTQALLYAMNRMGHKAGTEPCAWSYAGLPANPNPTGIDPAWKWPQYVVMEGWTTTMKPLGMTCPAGVEIHVVYNDWAYMDHASGALTSTPAKIIADLVPIRAAGFVVSGSSVSPEVEGWILGVPAMGAPSP